MTLGRSGYVISLREALHAHSGGSKLKLLEGACEDAGTWGSQPYSELVSATSHLLDAF